ncbi:hypothetical protein CS022_03030 [Veronia nyctiphanis]|uniref:Uncharacterized protein n=1 Tax=Veronia nyctiphanis TaxID=1278244 RepID=A0A4Q0YZI6_9GAMM|nr:VCBS repeat-containing protein [Veronia nyctiphanis]RXJ74561.1 hypothetical protein CS022_03030 [Veronia nyctiphanis]
MTMMQILPIGPGTPIIPGVNTPQVMIAPQVAAMPIAEPTSASYHPMGFFLAQRQLQQQMAMLGMLQNSSPLQLSQFNRFMPSPFGFSPAPFLPGQGLQYAPLTNFGMANNLNFGNNFGMGPNFGFGNRVGNYGPGIATAIPVPVPAPAVATARPGPGHEYWNSHPALKDAVWGPGNGRINEREIIGGYEGGWLCQHGGYKKNKDGSFEITKGQWADHKCIWIEERKCYHVVCCKSGHSKGCWKPPGGHNKVASPLTFDLNGNGKVDTTKGGKAFDINGDGKVDNTAWAGKGDGVLAFDANGDGRVGTDGKELFGNNADIDGDGRADGLKNGFDALKALAIKHLGQQAVADGKLNAEELAVLEQRAGLTMVVNGQNQSLADLGITEINLGYQEAGLNADENGNQHRQVGAGFTMNGKEQQAVNDVWFQYQ